MACKHHEKYKDTIIDHTANTTFPPGWAIIMTVKFGHFRTCRECREWAIKTYKLNRGEVTAILEEYE